MDTPEGTFCGTLEKQIPFQEHIYQNLEAGRVFFCSTEYMFQQVKDPDMFMEYLDKVSQRCRFRGNAGKYYVVYPHSYKFADAGAKTPDPEDAA